MRVGVLMRDKNDVNTSEKTGMKVETTAEVSELRQINLLALDI